MTGFARAATGSPRKRRGRLGWTASSTAPVPRLLDRGRRARRATGPASRAACARARATPSAGREGPKKSVGWRTSIGSASRSGTRPSGGRPARGGSIAAARIRPRCRRAAGLEPSPAMGAHDDQIGLDFVGRLRRIASGSVAAPYQVIHGEGRVCPIEGTQLVLHLSRSARVSTTFRTCRCAPDSPASEQAAPNAGARSLREIRSEQDAMEDRHGHSPHGGEKWAPAPQDTVVES